MAAAIYLLCAAISLLSAVLLLRSYGRSKYALLRTSAYCFLGLAATNLLVLVDKEIVPNVDLHWLRLLITLISLSFLLYGLMFRSE